MPKLGPSIDDWSPLSFVNWIRYIYLCGLTGINHKWWWAMKEKWQRWPYTNLRKIHQANRMVFSGRVYARATRPSFFFILPLMLNACPNYRLSTQKNGCQRATMSCYRPFTFLLYWLVLQNLTSNGYSYLPCISITFLLNNVIQWRNKRPKLIMVSWSALESTTHHRRWGLCLQNNLEMLLLILIRTRTVHVQYIHLHVCGVSIAYNAHFNALKGVTNTLHCSSSDILMFVNG